MTENLNDYVSIVGLDAGANFGYASLLIYRHEDYNLIIDGNAYTFTVNHKDQKGIVDTMALADHVFTVLATAQEYANDRHTDLIVVCEGAFIGRNANTFGLASLALRNIVINQFLLHLTQNIATQQNSVYLFEPSQGTLKKALTGKGNASKGEMQEFVKGYFGLPKRVTPDHASDALGMCIWGAEHVVKRPAPILATAIISPTHSTTWGDGLQVCGDEGALQKAVVAAKKAITIS